VAGALFVLEPSGRLMGMTEATLARSPFGSYLVPGSCWFTVVGGTQALAAWAEMRRWPPGRMVVRGRGRGPGRVESPCRWR